MAFAQPAAGSKPFDLQLQGKGVPETATLYVRYFTGKKLTLAPVHFKKGTARYTLTITEPSLVMLFLARDGAGFNAKERTVPMEKLMFYADPEAKSAVISFNGFIGSGKVQSGLLEKDFQQYSTYLQPYDKQLEALYQQRSKFYQSGAQEEGQLGKVAAAIERVQAEKDSAKLAFARQFQNSYFALLGLKEAAGYHINAREIGPIFKGLDPQFQQSPMGLALGKSIALAAKLQVGLEAPGFLQYDTAGKAVRLSDFKGKYVLVDFWVSWCGPCRAQNPQVVALYNKFKGKSFEIIGVSLDRHDQKDKWLQAIDHDGLNWIQVSDLKGWENAAAKSYGITAVPQNYLIGPKGHIVAADMDMESLAKLLGQSLD